MKKLDVCNARNVLEAYEGAINLVMDNKDGINAVLQADELKDAIQTCARLALGFVMTSEHLCHVLDELKFPAILKDLDRKDVIPDTVTEEDKDVWVEGQAFGIARAIGYIESSINPECEVDNEETV